MPISSETNPGVLRYLERQIETATPQQRTLMLFDFLASDLIEAEDGFTASDFKKINDALVHAQQVLATLRDLVDLDTELGRSLHAIYTFSINQLIEANLRKDHALIGPVRDMTGRVGEAMRRVLSDPQGASVGV